MIKSCSIGSETAIRQSTMASVTFLCQIEIGETRGRPKPNSRCTKAHKKRYILEKDYLDIDIDNVNNIDY